jgi:acyl transferase domain-containing protein/acyl carrier protein
VKSKREYSGLEIAIIGMACRFPGAANLTEFWKNLSGNVESIHFLSEKELIDLGVSEIVFKKDNYVNATSALKDKDCFDNHFFDYTPVEAAMLNPEHRIFHECIWEALEDAGYNADNAKGLIGICAGGGEDFNWKIHSMIENNGDVEFFLLHRINNKDYLTSLVSYKLDFNGPVFSIQTACSTSLVAIHQACRNLLLGEAKLMLAGGSRLFTEKQKGYLYQEGSVLSKDGRCNAFDNDASGTFFSEGAGVVVLKRLKDAIEDRDHIYAIIKGSAINNDGSRKVGFTAPGIEGQVECVRMAQKFAKVQPGSIGYVEAHGTGTALGDPIEVEALNIAFNRDRNKHCALGSLKTNIGHLDAAAGVAGLIKVALSLKHKKIPASLNCNTPSRKIDFEGGPFYVNTTLKDWQRNGGMPLRAGVNSLGLGGTNAHVILEEAPDRECSDEGNVVKILTVSAKTSAALMRYTDKLRDVLQQPDPINLSDMAYTLQMGRKAFEYRLSLTFTGKEELISLLNAESLGEQINSYDGKVRPAVFMFPGAGSQYANMGRDLYEKEKVFRQHLDAGLSFLRKITDTEFIDVLYPASAADMRINEMQNTQPIIFLFEYALARLLISYGVSPTYMIGHSTGEYVAACLSGVFSYEDALKLVVKRAQLMYSQQPGAMVSAAINETAAAEYVTDNISIAAINGPDQVVFSGDVLSMDKLMELFNRLDIQFVKLYASHAGHSPMIEDILDDYRKELQQVSLNAPKLPFVSNLTGNFITDSEAVSVDYWLQHMRKTVRFYDGIQRLSATDPRNLFIEVGAGHSLVSLLKQFKRPTERPLAVNLVRSVKENENDHRYFLSNIGKLWEYGAAINWSVLYRDERRQKISLPAYSFEKNRFPAEVDPIEKLKSSDQARLLHGENNELKHWIYYPVWKSSYPWPADKQVTGKVILYFTGDGILYDSVRNALTKRGCKLIQVENSDRFIKHSTEKYTIDGGNAGHFSQLLELVKNDGLAITDIVYSWNIAAGLPSIELSEKNETLHVCFFGLVNIVKALKQNNDISEKRIIVITDALHKVIGNESVNCAQSLLLGLVNALPQEYSVSCCNIDVDLAGQHPALADGLANEIHSNEGIENRIVALRYGQRWIKEFRKNTFSVTGKQSPVKKGGVYLITGGLGNVGLILSKYLIETYKAKLILTGRREIPANDNPLVQNQQSWIINWNNLKSISTDLLYVSVDVSDTDAFQKAVNIAESKLGPVQGIIHAAGIIDTSEFELVEDISMSKALNMFAPKLSGLHSIYSVLRNRNIDFVWITSSLASVLAGLSYGSYSSANLYMEHFVASKSHELKNWRCVGLGEMAFDEESIAKEQDQGRTALIPEEIIALFEWSLSLQENSTIIESAMNLSDRIHRVYERKREVYLDNELPVVAKKERPHLRSRYIPPVTETEKKLVVMLEEFFGIQNIGIEDNFFELGGDSLKAMVMLKRIRRDMNVTLKLKEFFAAKNLKQVAEEIDNILWVNAEPKTNYEIII